jgi:hypothetical protein
MLYVAVSALYPGALEYQLEQLERQDDQDFAVIILDAGWDKSLDDLLKKTTLKHVIRQPYTPAPGARAFDWAQWNSAFLVPESDDDYVFRFQAGRIMPSNTVRVLKELNQNVAFERKIVHYSQAHQDEHITHPRTPHIEYREDRCLDGATGDWCLRVGDFIAINGIDECLTMCNHMEDVDMEARWRIACQQGLMQGSAFVRDFYFYVDHACRTVKNDHYSLRERFPPLCGECLQRRPAFTLSNDSTVPVPEGTTDLGVQWGKRWLHCRNCGTLLAQLGSPHFAIWWQGEEPCAPAGLLGKYGRDLRYARQLRLKLKTSQFQKSFITQSYRHASVVMNHQPYRERSMFNPPRWQLLEDCLRCLPPKGSLAEIGTHRCGVCAYLAARCPGREVYGFDRFEAGLSELGPKDMPVSQSYHEGVQGSSLNEALAWAGGFMNLRLTPGDVRQTLGNAETEPLALAIIDLNLYEPTKVALQWAWERLVPGGFLLMDDPDFPGVKATLEESGLPYRVRQGMAFLSK